jgi:2,3-bisphosphoglycerate-independent phosphoglycerate mutase
LLDPLNPQPATLAGGSLNDIAPTILQILGIQPPAEMDGKSLAGRREFSKDRKVLLVILDGWGTNPESENNPISLASAPFWYSLLANNPHTLLEASGESVGLLPDKTGNSEAGHLNIGAGRIVPQDDLRLDAAMNDGSFYSNEIILQTIQKAHKNGKKLHLLALLTEKSSHGSIDYPLAILKMAKTCDFTDVYLHMILDGRSTAPCSAPALLEKLQMKMEEIGAGQIVSGMGRGIALDRDGNYHKTRMAYEALVEGNRKRVRYP